MSDKGTKITFGGRQARALCNMSHAARLDFIAEGLPIILQSNQSEATRDGGAGRLR